MDEKTFVVDGWDVLSHFYSLYLLILYSTYIKAVQSAKTRCQSHKITVFPWVWAAPGGANVSAPASIPHSSLPFAEKLNDFMADTSRKLDQNISTSTWLKSPPRGFEVKIYAQDSPGLHHRRYKCTFPKRILFETLIIL